MFPYPMSGHLRYKKNTASSGRNGGMRAVFFAREPRVIASERAGCGTVFS